MGVTVVLKQSAVKFALTPLGSDVNLRCTITRGRVRVRTSKRELTDVINARSLRSKVGGIRANEIVLNVNAITRNIRKRSALTIDGSIGSTIRRGSSLECNKRERISPV